MKKALCTLAAVAVFAFAGSAVAAPAHISPSVTAGHSGLTTVKATHKAHHKAKHHKKAAKAA